MHLARWYTEEKKKQNEKSTREDSSYFYNEWKFIIIA